MAVISANGAKGHHQFNLHINEISTSVANNTSTVEFSFNIAPIQTSWNWEQWGTSISYSININGSVYSGYIPNYDGYNVVVLKTGSLSIPHNSDGSKSISFSFSVSDGAGQYYTCGNASASGSMTLTKIPRYASITTFKVDKYTETQVKVTWEASASCDKIWYSKDNGSNWVEAIGYPNFYINGLSANTKYNFKIRVRRTDSQLTTDSSTVSQTTYDYPYCTSAPNFTIGNDLKIDLYNPLKRSITITMVGADGSTQTSGSYTSTSVSGFSNTSWSNFWYKSIPNAKSGTYTVKVNYGSVVKTKTGGTYTINSNNCTPTVGSVSYKDSNSTTTAITEDNQRIIRNNSNLLFTVGTATAKNSASISKYEITFNKVTKSRTSIGDLNFGTVNIASNSTATLKVTDSRGLTASKNIAVTVDDWILPTALITIKRKNNFYSESYLKVDGSCSYINGKNAITIQYQYKKVSDSSYSSLANISDNTQATLDLDNNSAWDFKIIVKDKLGSTTYNVVLNRGVPLIYFDRYRNSIGINCFPNSANSMYLNGYKLDDGIAVYEGGNTDPNTTLDEYVLTRHENNPYGQSVFAYIHTIFYSKKSETSHRTQIAYPYNSHLGIYERYYNSGSWSDWRQVGSASKVLYENSSGSDGTITLNESVAKFNYIKIYYRTWDGANWVSSTEVDNPDGKTPNLTCYVVGDGTSIAYIRSKNVSINGTSITNSGSRYIAITMNDNSSPDTTNGNAILITKVVGYR